MTCFYFINYCCMNICLYIQLFGLYNVICMYIFRFDLCVGCHLVCFSLGKTTSFILSIPYMPIIFLSRMETLWFFPYPLWHDCCYPCSTDVLVVMLMGCYGYSFRYFYYAQISYQEFVPGIIGTHF